MCGSAEVADAAFLVRFDMVVGLVLGMVLGMVLDMIVGFVADLFEGPYGQSS